MVAVDEPGDRVQAPVTRLHPVVVGYDFFEDHGLGEEEEVADIAWRLASVDREVAAAVNPHGLVIGGLAEAAVGDLVAGQ
jgi:hypothetical protein